MTELTYKPEIMFLSTNLLAKQTFLATVLIIIAFIPLYKYL